MLVYAISGSDIRRLKRFPIILYRNVSVGWICCTDTIICLIRQMADWEKITMKGSFSLKECGHRISFGHSTVSRKSPMKVTLCMLFPNKHNSILTWAKVGLFRNHSERKSYATLIKPTWMCLNFIFRLQLGTMTKLLLYLTFYQNNGSWQFK